MIHQLEFAPLDGITRAVFRRVWRKRFGGADRILIPFFSPTEHHVMTKRDLRELDPEALTEAVPDAAALIPQVMTRRAPDLIWAAETARDLGFREINLNAGCPSGTVTGKGKGAGLLLHTEDLDRLLEESCGKLCLPLSVKTRPGFFSPDEFPRILEILNRYPLRSVTLHARAAKQKYAGPLSMEAIGLALRESRNPVCCNGDLRTVGEIRAFAGRFPTAEAVMIGRGAVADPALFRKLRGGAAASREELRSFTAELYREYQAFYGHAGPAAQRMREVWYYLIHLFDLMDPAFHRFNRQMRRFRGPGEYAAAEAAIFAQLPLTGTVTGDLA